MRHNAVAVIVEAGRILLIHENYDLRRFGPPGGTVEPGETPEQAAAREVLEETGLIVDVGERLLWDELMGAAPFVAHAFEATITAGEPRLPRPDEIQSVGWYDLTDLPSPRTTTLVRLESTLRRRYVASGQ